MQRLRPWVDDLVGEQDPLFCGIAFIRSCSILPGIVVGGEFEAAGDAVDVGVDTTRRLCRTSSQNTFGGFAS